MDKLRDFDLSLCIYMYGQSFFFVFSCYCQNKRHFFPRAFVFVMLFSWACLCFRFEVCGKFVYVLKDFLLIWSKFSTGRRAVRILHFVPCICFACWQPCTRICLLCTSLSLSLQKFQYGIWGYKEDVLNYKEKKKPIKSHLETNLIPNTRS